MHETPTPSTIEVPPEHSALEGKAREIEAELKNCRKLERDGFERSFAYSELVRSLRFKIDHFQDLNELKDGLVVATQTLARVDDENALISARVADLERQLSDVQTEIHKAILAQRQ